MADSNPHPDPELPPTSGTTNQDGNITGLPSEKPNVSSSISKVLTQPTSEVKKYASSTDELLNRLSKMIKTTAGLGAFLSTLNYSLYLAAYLHSRSPTRAAIINYISGVVGRPGTTSLKTLPTTLVGDSPLTPLGALVSETRTSLRLTGTIPLYIWLRTLLSSDTSSKDPLLHTISLIQCSSYLTYQLIENTYHLAAKNVVPIEVINRRGGLLKWVAVSCRFWLAGISCDFLRLFREGQLNAEKRRRGEGGSVKEQEEQDRKWYSELFVASMWFPVAIHYSLYDTGGLKGMNPGIVGFLGMMAGLGNFRNAWAATK